MSPRPVEFPKSEFDALLRLARDGHAAEALARMERMLTSAPNREALAGEAAAALAELARQAELTLDLATAERALEIALELRPRYADLHYQLACVFLRRGRRSEARRSLDQALKLNPRYLAARVERSLVDARDGLIGEALDSLRMVAREMPVGDPRAFQQGLSSLERADWDEADSLLKRALKITEPEISHHIERFHAYLEQGEPGRAAQMLGEILPRHPAYPDLHYLLGLAELKLGHYDDALGSLARALELNPDFHEARVQFAYGLECVGQTAQAGEQLALVLQCDPDHRRALELQRIWSRRSMRAVPAPER